MKIIKNNDNFNTILFAALVPDEVDRNGDIITEREITKTAHEFMENLLKKKVNVNHENGTDLDNVKFVESFIAPTEIEITKTEKIPKGSWLIGLKFDGKTYDDFKNGLYTGISIEGYFLK